MLRNLVTSRHGLDTTLQSPHTSLPSDLLVKVHFEEGAVSFIYIAG